MSAPWPNNRRRAKLAKRLDEVFGRLDGCLLERMTEADERFLKKMARRGLRLEQCKCGKEESPREHFRATDNDPED